MMTRKDYIEMAKALKEVNEQVQTDASLDTLYQTAKALCSVFRTDNARFDATRFMSACGFDEVR